MDNLSERDKKLLVLLATIVVGFVLYSFVFTPQFKKLDSLKTQNQQLQDQVIAREGKIASLNNLKNQVEEEKKTIMPLASRHFYGINQEDILSLINDFGLRSGLSINQIDFTEAEDLGFEFTGSHWEDVSGQASVASSPSTENGEDGTQTDTSQQFNPSENIGLTSAVLRFEGTYDELINLFVLMKENPQNVVSNQIQISKEDSSENAIRLGKNPNDYISGDISLGFFKIKSLELYMPEPVSVFESKVVPDSTKPSPFIAYDWINQMEPDNQVMLTAQQMANSIASSVASAQKSPIPKGVLSYKKPVELTRFDGLNGLNAMPSSEGIAADLSLQEAKNINYRIVSLNSQFPKEVAPDQRVMLGLAGRSLALSMQPESLTLTVYQPQPTGCTLEYVLVDANNNTTTVSITPSANFTGFKDFETKISAELAYPIKIAGINVSRISQNYPADFSVMFDSLYANYVVTK